MRSLTVQDKIVIHLYQFTNFEGKIAVPTEITQEGISDAIGVQRPHVSVDIKRMMEKGWIKEFKAHAGGRKKRKAYSLTTRGIKRYNEIMEKLRDRQVTVKIDGDEMRMNGVEAADYISSMMGLPYVLATEIVMDTQRIDKELIERKKEKVEKTVYSSPLPKFKEVLGRESEMEKIDTWYRSRSTCLVVVGTAGIGKTALVSSFVSKLRSPVFWHSIGEWESALSIISDLSEFMLKNGKTSLRDYLSSKNFDLGMVGRILKNIDERQIWVFDDYQKASDDVREMFNMLLSALKGTSVRLIVLSRSIPDFYSRKDVSISRDVYELFLEGLSMDAARDILVRKGIYPSETQFREIYSFTAGHPLALELIAASGMRKEAAKAYLAEEAYRNLNVSERKMLSELSVYRKHALPDAIVRTEKDVETLRSLIRKGMVYYDSEERYFMHDLMRAFLKERKSMKKEHMRAYETYKKRDRIDSRIEAIYHSMMAEEMELAEELAMELLDEAVIKGRGNEMLSTLNTKESDLYGILFAKARAMQATGRLKDAERMAKRLIRESKGEKKIRAMVLLSLIYATAGKLDESLKLLESAIGKAESEELEADIRYHLGMAYIRKGMYERAEDELVKAMEYYANKGDEEREARIKAQYASVIAGRGEEERAIRMLRNLAEFFVEKGDYRVLGNIYNNMAKYEAVLGKKQEALADLEKAALYADLSGHAQLLGYALMNSANIHLGLGDVEKALMMAERAKKVMENMGDKRGLAILKTVIAEAHELMGDDAERYYEDAEKSLLELGLKKHLGELYMERGDIAKDGEKRMEYYKKAMEIFKEVKYESGIRRIEERIGES
jgi:tetratricopeptide (TPR) repeat protein/DNA-binding PadR family transcriptional regulator